MLSQREVGHLLEQLDGVPRLAVLLMYGSGLRVLETVSLRVKDIDFDRREIVMRGGKGEGSSRAARDRGGAAVARVPSRA